MLPLAIIVSLVRQQLCYEIASPVHITICDEDVAAEQPEQWTTIHACWLKHA